jgi:hypothetical protein
MLEPRQKTIEILPSVSEIPYLVLPGVRFYIYVNIYIAKRKIDLTHFDKVGGARF